MGPKTIVCISCYYKGYDFLDEMKALGNHVILITSENIRDKQWPWHAIDEVFYMPEIAPSTWNLDDLVKGFSFLMRTHKVDAVVALDDYDVEKAALLRETFRIPGMGQTTYRYFRDKLAMRQHAKYMQILVPEFTAVFNDSVICDFTQKVAPPWVLKPRSEASATGIKKINSEHELWLALHNLGDERHLFLLESFKPGNVYHVDSLVYDRKIVFSCASQYLAPPMQVSQEGGVFRTKTLDKSSEDSKALQQLNNELLRSFGLVHGAAHSEYIKGDDGKYYFLETSSRVGGAYIPELVEAATGINIWREWARLENAVLVGKKYEAPEAYNSSAGLVIALAKEENPATVRFECEYVYKFLPLDYHIGIVYKSDRQEVIQQKLDESSQIITEHILNIIPPKDKPTS